MKLTLRKANALQNAIQDHIKTIDVKNTIQLNEFQSPEVELPKALATLVDNDTRRFALMTAIYNIRASVGRANVESGVADLLTRAALVDKRLAHLKGFTESKTQENASVLEGKLAKMREGGERRVYGYNDSIESGVLTDVVMETFKIETRALKKEKQSINDKVLELNVRTEIELDAQTVELLQKEQLI